MSFNTDERILSLAQNCINTWKEGRTVLMCGNGGSASQADHFVGESLGRFSKDRKPLPSINLSSSNGVITCISNDFGYSNVFSRQIEAFKITAGLLICLSTSGKSKNIIMAMKESHKYQINTFLITGKECNEEIINDYCKNIIKINSSNTAYIQEKTLEIMHTIFKNTDESF